MRAFAVVVPPTRPPGALPALTVPLDQTAAMRPRCTPTSPPVRFCAAWMRMFGRPSEVMFAFAVVPANSPWYCHVPRLMNRLSMTWPLPSKVAA